MFSRQWNLSHDSFINTVTGTAFAAAIIRLQNCAAQLSWRCVIAVYLLATDGIL